MSLYERLCMVRTAWAQVGTNVIINCWRKSRLLSEDVKVEYVVDSDEDMNQIAAIEDEEDVAAPSTTCIDSFVALLTPQNETNDQEKKNKSDIEEFDHDSTQETTIISTSDCLKYLSLIKNKLIYSSDQTPNFLVELQHILMSLPKMQTTIKDFFKSENSARDYTSTFHSYM